MNWYKLADFDMQDFDDRNIVNDKVRFFEMTREYLNKLAKVVFQSSRLARAINNKILNHQKMSSYPTIKEILAEADKVAMDSPWRFAAYCKIAVDEIERKLVESIRERKEFTESTLPNRMKGFTSDAP